jgi:hypothetical protein
MANASVIKYEVRFSTSETVLPEMKTLTINVNDTGDENLNKGEALVTAMLKLDDEGFKYWVIKGCAKVTS